MERVELREILEDQIGPRLERVAGVSRIRWYGGSRREIQVLLDLDMLDSVSLAAARYRTMLERLGASID